MQTSKLSTATILGHLGIEALNAMQLASIEANEIHKDVILLSATGSGKTLGFLLPLLGRLDEANKDTQAMVIVPSRELALQIEEVFRSMRTGYKVTCCYGGHLRETEENNLVQPPALIIGTPGRLADHIRRGNITVDAIQTLILDEFDKSLEYGFQEEMAFIIGSLKNVSKRILTSATEAVEIPDYVGMKAPERLNFLTGSEEKEQRLEVKTVKTDNSDKSEALFRILCAAGGKPAIVFCNHREAVERTSQLLHARGIVNEYYHGAMEQQERDSALCKFRNGTANVLVTTDLASRGLDIAHVRYIIHYQLPHAEDIYTHRNGRTARMDASGTAVLIIGPGEYVPPYLGDNVEEMRLPADAELPEKPKWTTLFISGGKKDKINKIDIVGFLAQKGGLKKEDIGLIEVKDFFAFAAIRKSKANTTVAAVRDQKIKNKRLKIEIAR